MGDIFDEMLVKDKENNGCRIGDINGGPVLGRGLIIRPSVVSMIALQIAN